MAPTDGGADDALAAPKMEVEVHAPKMEVGLPRLGHALSNFGGEHLS